MRMPGLSEPRDRLIVALDVPTRAEAENLIASLEGIVSFYKIGLQLFLAEGMSFVRSVTESGKRVFLDLKMDDVEETITQAVREIAKSNIHFLTIHGSGATARAAIAGRSGAEMPKVLSVTLLSSLDQRDLIDLQILGDKGKFKTLDEYVLWRAEQAVKSGCDGVIASGTTIAQVRDRLGDKPIIVAPGIRPSGTTTDDHKRSATPMQAIQQGADYLVVGRPIRNAAQPARMAQSIIDEIEQGAAAGV